MAEGETIPGTLRESYLLMESIDTRISTGENPSM